MKLKKNKHRIKKVMILGITMFFIGIYLSFQYLENNISIKLNDSYENFLLDREYSNNTVIHSFSNIISNKKLVPYQEEKKDKASPIIYIYNTHQTEEYSSNDLFSFRPNVTMVDYILESTFESREYETLVEERSIKEILNANSWNYAASYLASRIYLEDVIKTYPTLQYFIDVHRDSLPHEKTTITIKDKEFAKLLFIVGLENENYQANLDFTYKIHNKLEEKYPNLSKGILQKSGVGVNGVYNQDFSPYTILVEVGGEENTTYEVLNATKAFAECFLEVVNESQN